MISHTEIPDIELRRLIRQSEIQLAGNRQLKIYGRLDCNSGRRMKRENRMFFRSKEEAKKHGYRPCGQCMKTAYELWKGNLIKLM